MQPGDTLQVESEILEIVASRSKPNQAIVKVRSTTLNQHGEAEHSFTSKCVQTSIAGDVTSFALR